MLNSFLQGYLHKEAIIGIPDKSYYGNLNDIQEGMPLDFIVQDHNAKRSGRHNDMRLGNPYTGLFSWATKHPLPKPGEKRAWYSQPLHSYQYKDYEGEIVPGYGHGSVKKAFEGKVVITRVTPEHISFSILSERHPQRFVMIKPKDKTSKSWLVLNTTPKASANYDKGHYKVIQEEEIDDRIKNLQEGTSVQAKLDGAHALVDLLDNTPEVVSHRVSKTTGANVLQTERIFGGRPIVEIPEELKGLRLAGEVIAEDEKGNILPVQQLSGVLNSAPSKALDTLKQKKAKLKIALFNAVSKNGEDLTSRPYTERRKLLEEAVKVMPDKFFLPETATDAKSAKALLDKIRQGKLKQTTEGLVIHPETGTPEKYVIRPEEDVYISNVFPGEEGKYKTSAGGFEYSLIPGGKVVGRVGTGFDDDFRQFLWDNKDSVIGRKARIEAKGAYPSGAYRAPSFVTLHEE